MALIITPYAYGLYTDECNSNMNQNKKIQSSIPIKEGSELKPGRKAAIDERHHPHPSMAENGPHPQRLDYWHCLVFYISVIIEIKVHNLN